MWMTSEKMVTPALVYVKMSIFAVKYHFFMPMKKVLLSIFALATAAAVHAQIISVVVKDTRYQTVTGFGAACCDGAMCPFGSDTAPVRLLYGPQSKIGLNIMRMEISPNFKLYPRPGKLRNVEPSSSVPHGRLQANTRPTEQHREATATARAISEENYVKTATRSSSHGSILSWIGWTNMASE